jgi:hypothetical protein
VRPVDKSEVGYENVGGTGGGADPVVELTPAPPAACKPNAEVQLWTAPVAVPGGSNVFCTFCGSPGGGAWAGAFPPAPAPAPAPVPAAAAAAAGAGCASSLEGGSYHHGGVSTSRPSQSASSPMGSCHCCPSQAPAVTHTKAECRTRRTCGRLVAPGSQRSHHRRMNASSSRCDEILSDRRVV